MDPRIQHATEFLAIVREAVGRLEEFAYSMVPRFKVMKRNHAQAHMVNGGFFSIGCSFPCDTTEPRIFIWAININWLADEWVVQAFAEEEDDYGTKRSWSSAPLRAKTMDEFARCLAEAHEAIEASLAITWVQEIFTRLKKRETRH